MEKCVYTSQCKLSQIAENLEAVTKEEAEAVKAHDWIKAKSNQQKKSYIMDAYQQYVDTRKSYCRDCVLIREAPLQIHVR